MSEARRGGKKGRKHGNKARKPTFQRYWAQERRRVHKARNVRRFEDMVLESRERRTPEYLQRLASNRIRRRSLGEKV